METEKSIVKSHNSNQSTTIRKNYILVIGIDDYTHCPKLNNAVKDVKDFIDLITNNFLLDKINIIELYDKDATYEKILDKFKYLVQNVTLYDNVIIYFSGHGELDEVLDEGFWIPVEAEREKENEFFNIF